ncbi:MAG TPA: trigger factor family protein, partial [Pseudonocardiaceae bacterium]|nr:trigger factor family protein [Pseudonocardiaceae bacterium]
MKSTVEQLSPTRVKINIEVPFEELKPDFDRAYKKIAQQVTIPGFRPGKAPARILEQRLGRGAVLEEV